MRQCFNVSAARSGSNKGEPGSTEGGSQTGNTCLVLRFFSGFNRSEENNDAKRSHRDPLEPHVLHDFLAIPVLEGCIGTWLHVFHDIVPLTPPHYYIPVDCMAARFGKLLSAPHAFPLFVLMSGPLSVSSYFLFLGNSDSEC